MTEETSIQLKARREALLKTERRLRLLLWILLVGFIVLIGGEGSALYSKVGGFNADFMSGSIPILVVLILLGFATYRINGQKKKAETERAEIEARLHQQNE